MAQAIAQIASVKLTTATTLIYTAADNVALQSLWIVNQGTQANHIGDEDLSGGYDFDVAPKSFQINVNGTGDITVDLDSTTTNVATVVAEINTQLRTASANSSTTPDTFDRQNPLVEVYASGNYVGIRTINYGDSFVLTEVDALTVLGWSAGNYDSTDIVHVNLRKVASGGSIGTPADERNILPNKPVSTRDGAISASPGIILTSGEKIYAWASVADLVTLELSGTSGVA